MADAKVRIDVGTQGAEGASQAVREVGTAAEEANRRSTRAVQTAARSQQQAARMAGAAMQQLQSMVLMYVGAAAAMKFVMDGVKSAMADESSFVRATGTIHSMGLATDTTTQRLRDFGTELQATALVADDQVFPAFTRLLTATKDLADAEYLTELAMKFTLATGAEQRMTLEAITTAAGGTTGTLYTLLQRYGMVGDRTMKLAEMTAFMEQKIKDSGEVMATTEVRFKQLGMTMADVGEVVGGVLLKGFQYLMLAVSTAVNAIAHWYVTLGTLWKAAITNIGELGRIIKLAFTEGPVAAFSYAITQAKANWQELKTDVGNVWEDFTLRQGSVIEQLGLKTATALEMLRSGSDDLGKDKGGGAGEAAAKAEFDRMAMLRRQFANSGIEAELDKAATLREIDQSLNDSKRAASDRTIDQQVAANKRFEAAYAASSEKTKALTLGGIEAMSGAWGNYFANREAYEERGISLAEVTGRAMLAFVLSQLKQELAAHAAKFAALAVANLIAGNLIGAGQNAAAAAFLAGGALIAGMGAAAAAPSLPTVPLSEPATEPGGGGGGSGSGGGSSGYGGGSGGGAGTITNSTVTLNYSPVLVVNGHVFGIGDLKEMWTEWNREHSFLAGEGLNTGTRRG